MTTIQCGKGHPGTLESLGRVCPQCWIEINNELAAAKARIEEQGALLRQIHHASLDGNMWAESFRTWARNLTGKFATSAPHPTAGKEPRVLYQPHIKMKPSTGQEE